MTSSLAVFDFDRTVIAGDSDSTIIRLLEEKKPHPPVHNCLTPWTPYMGNIFDQLHQAGFRKKDILARIADMPAMCGMPELINALHAKGWTLIVLSDANSIFIEHWLKKHGLRDKFSEIITNRAHFDQDEKLIIQPYGNKMKCTKCSPNFCKRQGLAAYMEGRNFEQVIYIGDGRNDYCPITSLTENDIVFAREKHPLAHKIAETKLTETPEVICPHYLWDNGLYIYYNLYPVENC